MTTHEVLEYDRAVLISDGIGGFTESDLEAPEVWVPFLDRESAWEDSDIQVEQDGWAVVQLADRSANMHGAVSLTGLTDEMQRLITSAAGVYALVEVQGVAGDELAGAGVYDRSVGDVLMRYDIG